MAELTSCIRLKNVLYGTAGSAIISFGIYNIHNVADITEGGIIGLNLLVEYWFGISPAYTNAILTVICFAIGWKMLGREFIIYSVIFSLAFSAFYRIFEVLTPPFFPQIAEHPWIASVTGSLFVGTGAGLSVRAGGAQCGDDALAMVCHQYFGVKLSTAYLFGDLTVLILSLSYIPFRKILCSLLTVILSSRIVDIVTTIQIPEHTEKN